MARDMTAEGAPIGHIPEKKDQGHFKLPSVKTVARTVVAGGALAAAAAGARFGLEKSQHSADVAQPVPVTDAYSKPEAPAVIQNLSQESWLPVEVVEPFTSYNQVKAIVESFPVSVDPNAKDYQLKQQTLAEIDKYMVYEQNVKAFVDAYHSFKDPDGTPTLLRLEKQKYYNLDLSVLIQGGSRFTSVDQLLEDNFFFMAQDRYRKIDLSHLTQQINSLSKQKTVKGIQAFESMKRVINSSVLASTIEEGGFYSLPESSETGQVNFDVSALSGNIDKNGRTIEQDEALVKQGLALLPQIGNQNIKFFESLKASPNPNNPNGDVWGLYRLSDGGKSSMIWIDRNSPGELVLIAAHEGSHSLDIDKYDSLISRYNSPEQMIKLWIARDEAIQANRYLPDGTRIIPFPVWDKYYPYVNGDKAALAKIEPTEFTKMTKEIYYKLSDDTELFAEQFSKFLTGKTGLEPGEKIAYQKYLDLLKNFSK